MKSLSSREVDFGFPKTTSWTKDHLLGTPGKLGRLVKEYPHDRHGFEESI